jgi:primosomal protein N' (replication factor Y)
VKRRNIPNARALRVNQTDAEKRLWTYLRNRAFFGFKFRRQMSVGPYIADFLCPARSLIIELDGGQHADSLRDAQRTAWLEGEGYRVIRFWNNDVLANTEGVLTQIHAALGAPPHPTLSPEGRGL